MKRLAIRVALTIVGVVVLVISIPLGLASWAGEGADWVFWRTTKFGRLLIDAGTIYARRK